MAGGNAHQRAINKAARERTAKNMPESAVPIQASPEDQMVGAENKKKRLHKLLDLFEQPLFLWSAGIVGGLVGLFLFTPVLFVCGCCFVLAFHRAKVVQGDPPKTQIISYVVLICVVAALLWYARQLIKANLPNSPSEIAKAVSKEVIKAILRSPTSGVPDLGWGKEIDINDSFDPQHPGVVLILWIGSIENHSDVPSTTRNWKLEVTLPGDSNPRPTELFEPEGKNLEIWSGMQFGQGKSTVFTWNNYLPELTAKNAIVKGDPPIGFVGFIVRDVPNQGLVIGTRLVLSFDDGMGKTISHGRILDKPVERKPYIPGLLKLEISRSI